MDESGGGKCHCLWPSTFYQPVQYKNAENYNQVKSVRIKFPVEVVEIN